MKRNKLLDYSLIASLLFFCCMCKNNDEIQQTSNTLSDEQIATNLSKTGKIDPDLLVGNWGIKNFAYTVDGKIISNEAPISKGRLNIPLAPTPTEYEQDDKWWLSVYNLMGFICELSGNFIKLTFEGSTYLYVTPPNIEYDIIEAFINSYSFVIKGNELIIHFTGVDKRNLLIFKKM